MMRHMVNGADGGGTILQAEPTKQKQPDSNIEMQLACW